MVSYVISCLLILYTSLCLLTARTVHLLFKMEIFRLLIEFVKLNLSVLFYCNTIRCFCDVILHVVSMRLFEVAAISVWICLFDALHRCVCVQLPRSAACSSVTYSAIWAMHVVLPDVLSVNVPILARYSNSY